MDSVSRSSFGDREALRALRRRWWAALTLGVAALLLLATVLRRSGLDSVLWLAAATPMLAYGFAWVGFHLDENRRTAGTGNGRAGPSRPRLLETFGPGTGLTLLRIVALAALTGFLLLPWPTGALAWLPMALYTFVAVADWLDGYLARRFDHATELGARLDLELDGVAMLVAVGLAVAYGQLPAWYLTVGSARYLYLLAIRLRRNRAPAPPLPASRNRRLWAGFQMGFVSAALWPIVPSEGAHLAAWCFGLPFLLGFLRDTLVVAGHLDPAGGTYRRLREEIWPRLEAALPLGLRAVFVGVIVHWLRQWPAPLSPPGWSEAIVWWGASDPAMWRSVAVSLLLVGTTMLTLGLVARLGALLTTLAFAVEITAHGLPVVTGLGLVSVLGVMLLGSGAASIWRPEDELLRRQSGAPAKASTAQGG